MGAAGAPVGSCRDKDRPCWNDDGVAEVVGPDQAGKGKNPLEQVIISIAGGAELGLD